MRESIYTLGVWRVKAAGGAVMVAICMILTSLVWSSAPSAARWSWRP